MGVIHKLREDVVSFIIGQKKNTPSIGVRQLSVLTSEKFQIKVSKSSVSTVLKNASLSSNIGRRTLNASKDKKFTIPPDRKKEISENLQKYQIARGETLSTPKEINKLRKAPQNAHTPLPDQRLEERPIQAEKHGTIKSNVKDVSAEQKFLDHVRQIRDRTYDQKEKEYKGMGFVFMKAGQWEISNNSTMAALLKKHYGEGQLPRIFDVASEMFLFFNFSGTKNIDHISTYKEHGLWQLNICGDNTDEDKVLLKTIELFKRSETIGETLASKIAMEYNLEKNQIFSQVCNFKLTLEDGTKLNIDALFSKFSGSTLPSVTKGERIAINKAMTWLSNYLISNNSNIIFHSVAGDSRFDQTFYDLVAVFENLQGKKIIRISVLDKTDEPLAEFSTIPCKKRLFLTGVDPKRKEFVQLTGNAKWAGKKPFYHKETDKIVYFAETKSGCLGAQFQQKIDDFRVITIWREGEKKPFWAILTNKEEGSGEKVLRLYMSRWPYFNENQIRVAVPEAQTKGVEKNGNVTQKDEFIQFLGIFDDYVGRLNQYCQQRFFPPSYSENDISKMIQMVYETSGSINTERDRITVSLNIPESASYYRDLQYAAKRVNECHIFDYFGRRLWVRI